MACFTAPLAEAIVTSVIKHTALKDKPEWKNRISVLQQMLYGGSIILAAEHVYHGEVTFYPPFLTALKTPEDTAVMLHEIATVGTTMSVVVTAVWGIICYFAWKKSQKTQTEIKKAGRFRPALRVVLGTALMFSVDILFAALA